MKRAILVDHSRHQGQTDPEVLADHVDGVILRCTIGWSYLDPWYIYSFKRWKAIPDKIVAAYHVLWPENEDPKREARWFRSNAIVDGVAPDFVVCDDELMHGLSPANVLGQCKALAYETREQFGGTTTALYSSSWYWNGAKYLGTVTPGGWEHDFPLIEAEYLTPPLRYPRVWRFGEEPMEKEPKVLGRGWTKWWMWQWTSKMEPVGVSSKSQDAIVFNGSYQDLRRELGIGTPQPTLEEKVERLWEAHPELHQKGDLCTI